MSKKNNELRLYIDYRDLNTIIIKNRYSFFFDFRNIKSLMRIKDIYKIES